MPAELHATIMAGGGPGGYTGKFSPFGTVDITSNPAKLAIVDAQGNPTSGVVSGPGLVYVKATSSGINFHGSYLSGAYISPNPIPNVPINFGGTIVNTGANGIAQFNWTTAVPGGTLAATVNVPNDEGCPTAHSTPVTVAYRPLVCFTPNSVTFIELPATVIDYAAPGYSYLLVGPNFGNQSTPALSFPADSQGWSSPSFTQTSDWVAAAPAPFGQLVSPACEVYTTNPVVTLWPAATGGTPSPSTGSGLLLRKSFTAASGFSGHVQIKVAIDNDIQVFLDGHDVTDPSVFPGVTFVGVGTSSNVVTGSWSGYGTPFQRHGGCTARDAGTFMVPGAALSTGTSHLLAVYAHDYGGDSYVDVQVTLVP
jgi:hypothetical protein